MAFILDEAVNEFYEMAHHQEHISDEIYWELQRLRKLCSMMYEEMNRKGVLNKSENAYFQEILYTVQKMKDDIEARDALDQKSCKRLQQFFEVLENFDPGIRFERK